MVRLWKYSSLRFYILNTIWNYRFWLNAKPVYKTHHYSVEEAMDLNKTLRDAAMKVQPKKVNKTQKRFVGFHYKGVLFQDNPGIQGVDSVTWDFWIKKGLIKL